MAKKTKKTTPRAKSKSEPAILGRYEALQKIAAELIQPSNHSSTLARIVNYAVDLMCCDGGSLYLKSEKELVFEVAVNKSIVPEFRTQRVSITDDQGLAGFVFREGTPLIITDAYQIPVSSPYRFDDRFDRANKYRTRSVLVQPLVSSKGEKLGVLQLINRKPSTGQPWPSQDIKKLNKMPAFSKEDANLLRSFASLASASIENAKLYQNIENLFEGFVKAAVGVIERRDPSTRGHSERVAVLTVDLAEAVHRSNDAEVRQHRFTSTQFDELRYAALLHDFGKVSVPEATLLKREKLYEHDKDKIRRRLDSLVHGEELRLHREMVYKLANEKRVPSEMDLKRVDSLIKNYSDRFEEYWRTILELNEPTVIDEDKSKKIALLNAVELVDIKGEIQKLLDPKEVEYLSIKRGSLSAEERASIEAHVTQTYTFLKAIPWGDRFKDLAEIAYAHHEKLDGSGYPRKLKSEKIPVQSRIMTICDIFDALVAADRPYKKAVPLERALSIIEDEVKRGQLDPNLFRVFTEARVYESELFQTLNVKNPKKVA